jgi:hypothetical protein
MWQKISPPNSAKFFLKKNQNIVAEYSLRGFIFRISAEFGSLMVLLLLSRLRKIEERIPPPVRRDSSSRIPQ